jgi:hypothetical protein
MQLPKTAAGLALKELLILSPVKLQKGIDEVGEDNDE